ncbi:hypothetical protein N665_0177s0031 [Sinapis alba]|nr:hypothetical protein N665_0177s0031 [Sinapis alba]
MSLPLRVSPVTRPSYVWNNLSAARDLILLGIRKQIHSGFEVKVWEDPWIPTQPARPTLSLVPMVNPNMRVSDLINGETKKWDDALLERLVVPEDIALIKSLSISSSH